MHKTSIVGARYLTKKFEKIRCKPEMDAPDVGINKRHNITHSGPQDPSGTAWSLPNTDNNVMKLEMRFLLIFIFRKQ